MFHLPKEIIKEIYEFDNTYREIFDTVLENISQYQIFDYITPTTHYYYIYDNHKDISHITNDLINPNWISTDYTITKNKLKAMIKNNLIVKTHKKLEYDIENFNFVIDREVNYHELRFI